MDCLTKSASKGNKTKIKVSTQLFFLLWSMHRSAFGPHFHHNTLFVTSIGIYFIMHNYWSISWGASLTLLYSIVVQYWMLILTILFFNSGNIQYLYLGPSRIAVLEDCKANHSATMAGFVTMRFQCSLIILQAGTVAKWSWHRKKFQRKVDIKKHNSTFF